jgi:hypothetical protein
MYEWYSWKRLRNHLLLLLPWAVKSISMMTHSKYGEISAIDVQVEVDDNDNNDHCQDTTKTKVEVVLRSSSMIQYAGPSF